MSVTIVATPGSATANSYGTEAEATAYFAARLPLPIPWEDADDPTAALAMATRVLDIMSVARRVLRFDGRGGQSKRPYYVTSSAWTGTVATATQALAWPRDGMFDRLGRAIANTAVPQALKEAQFELAGRLIESDSTLDGDVDLQGIAEIKAGSVQVKFKDMVESRVLPDSVLNLLPPSWLTDELVSPAVVTSFRAL